MTNKIFAALAVSIGALPSFATLPTEITTSGSSCIDQRGNFPDKPYVETICVITNQERKKRKLKGLVLDPDLSYVAQKHAEDMAKRDFFDHTNPDGDSPFDRIKDARISYRSAAENISRGYKSPQAAMKGWMNSPGHKRNILGSNYGKIGIGFYQNHWVQVFTN